MPHIDAKFKSAHETDLIALGDAIKAAQNGKPASDGAARTLIDAIVTARRRVDAYRELLTSHTRLACESYVHS